MSEAKNYEVIIQFLTKFKNVNILEMFIQEYSTSENDFVAIEMKLVVLTNFSLKKKNFQKFFFYFQALFLLSYCEFLEKRKMSYETID